jgi:hypothetical protein
MSKRDQLLIFPKVCKIPLYGKFEIIVHKRGDPSVVYGKAWPYWDAGQVPRYTNLWIPLHSKNLLLTEEDMEWKVVGESPLTQEQLDVIIQEKPRLHTSSYVLS